MKQKYIYTLVLLLLQSIVFANVNITPSLGWGTFVNGLTGVNNTFSIPDNGYTSVTVDLSGVNTNHSGTATLNGATWEFTYDMGLLLDPSVVFTVNTDDGSTQDSGSGTLTSLPKPSWLTAGSASNVSVTGTTVSFQGLYPIYQLSQTIDASVKGIGNRPLDIVGKFVFDGSYNISNTSQTSVSNQKVQVDLNLLDQLNYTNDITFGGTCALDPTLNLAFTFTDSINTPEIKLNIPRMKFPIVAGVTVGIDAGITFFATLKGQLVIGQTGFIDLSGEKTKIIGRLTGEGFIRGNVDVLFGAAKGSAQLNAKVRLGAGFEYTTLGGGTPLIGGDLDIDGEVCYSTFWGLGPNGCKQSSSFYHGDFGDTNAVRSIANSFDKTFGARSITFHTDGTNQLPNFNPQPSFGKRKDKLYTVWIEEKGSNTGYLLFSKLNSAGTAFSTEKVVANNQNSISNPKVALLPNGSAIITWSQSRYTSSSFPSSGDEQNMLASEDVWMAFYDSNLDSIVYKTQLADDISTDESGRAEGNAEVAVGDGNEAMITWVSKDQSGGSDVYYSHLTETGGSWTLSSPLPIASNVGSNYEVHVAYTDTAQALAVWIKDADSDEETENNDIYFSKWDGSSWSAEQSFTSNSGNVEFKEISLSSNDGYTAIAHTSTQFNNDGDFQNRLDMEVWDDVNQQWLSSSHFEDVDSQYYFQSPHVSISETGKASICYQVINMFPDTSGADPGELYLYLRDLTTTSSWTEVTNNPYICDSNAFIWQLDAGFGGGDKFYTLTQEYNDNGVVTNPAHGIKFGDPSLSMVLRGLQVNSNLTVSDIQEPTVVPSGINDISIHDDLGWFQNYPNPSNYITTLKFQLIGKADVQLEVLDITGKQITVLVKDSLQQGIYETEFNSGNLPSGFYFAKLTVNNRSMTHKMIIAK